MTCTTRIRFRRLALALATAQMAIYATLPFAEARLERAPGPAAVEAHHTTDCAPVHNPATCLFCQVALVRAEAGTRTSAPQADESRSALASAPHAVAMPRAPPHEPPSRAPPLSLA